MPNARSPRRLDDIAQNVALIFTSLALLPVSSLMILLCYIARPFVSSQTATRNRLRQSRFFRPRTILVTGVGKTAGLALARTFYLAGHNVIGADFSASGIPSCGRFSTSVRKSYNLPKPTKEDGSAYYIQVLLQIIRRNKIDLWVSCSGAASAVEDAQAKEVIERRSDCRCIQLDVSTIQTLQGKIRFVQQATRLGLPTQETHKVTSRDAVHKVLHQSPKTKKRYVMKSVDLDDATRKDVTILPKQTLSETYTHISRIPISGDKPWVLEQYILGTQYTSHALVLSNHVKAFVACPSLSSQSHYSALPSTSALSKAMLRFTQEFARRSEATLTGHLSFAFLIDEHISEKGAELVLQAVECRPWADNAMVLFNGQSTALAAAYLSALETPSKHGPTVNGTQPTQEEEQGEEKYIITPADDSTKKYYHSGPDLIQLVLLPLLHFMTRRITRETFLRRGYRFIEHVLLWKDATFEIWDPLPWWWLYHVYWPGHFLAWILQWVRGREVHIGTGEMSWC